MGLTARFRQATSDATDAQDSEDCLFLNVYSPVLDVAAQKKKLPVLVWTHGGSWSVSRRCPSRDDARVDDP